MPGKTFRQRPKTKLRRLLLSQANHDFRRYEDQCFLARLLMQTVTTPFSLSTTGSVPEILYWIHFSCHLQSDVPDVARPIYLTFVPARPHCLSAAPSLPGQVKHLVCFSVRLPCSFQTRPTPQVRWMKVDPNCQDRNGQRYTDDPKDPEML